MRHGTRPGGRKGARWLDPEAIAAKQLRRRLERRWKKFGLESDRVAYRAACHHANVLINKSRSRHQYKHIVDAGSNPRRVWSAVKDLLYINQHDPITAPTDEDTAFCKTLAAFFVNKVRNIKAAISLSLAGQKFDPLSSDPASSKFLSVLDPVTETEVMRLLKTMSPKSSPLDFIPTSLIKSCSGAFAHIITRLANLSFSQSTFPHQFKIAQVTPLLKNAALTLLTLPVTGLSPT